VEGIGHGDTRWLAEADQAAPVIRTCVEEYILRVSNACSDHGGMVVRGGGSADGRWRVSRWAAEGQRRGSVRSVRPLPGGEAWEVGGWGATTRGGGQAGLTAQTDGTARTSQLV